MITEVPPETLGLMKWTKYPDTEEAEERGSSDWIVPEGCAGDALDDRVLFLHGGVCVAQPRGHMPSPLLREPLPVPPRGAGS